MFLAMGNHLEPFPEVSDPPEGQEKGGTKVTILSLGLLQPLHPVLDLQVSLRLLKMVPNDFPWPKTWV